MRAKQNEGKGLHFSGECDFVVLQNCQDGQYWDLNMDCTVAETKAQDDGIAS